MPFNQMSVDEMPFNKCLSTKYYYLIFVDKMSFNKVPLNQMSVNEMSFNQMSVDKMSFSQRCV